MTEKQFKCHLAVVGVHIGVGTDEHDLTGDECRDLLNELSKENEQLKNQNKLLSDELEQCRAVIDKRWNEYLMKKKLIE